MSYLFSTEYFGFTEKHFHFLRNRFSYKNITFSEIDEITITKGKILKRWPFVLTFGVACISFGLYYGYLLLNFLTSNQGGRYYVEELAVPVIPILLGSFTLYQALKTGEIMILKYNGKKDVFTLKELGDQQDDFIRFLKTRLPSVLRNNER